MKVTDAVLTLLRSQLASSDLDVVRKALVSVPELGVEAYALIPAISPLIDDPRYVDTGSPGAPSYRPLGFLALDALATFGAHAVDEVTAATRSTCVVTTPAACYDQGFYIGDYYTEKLEIGAYARTVLARLQRAPVA